MICAQVDGSLADGSPVSLTADVGVDALCHAMEAFVSKKSSPLSDGFALDALRGVGRHLRSAVDDEAEGRDGMARAAFLAGVSFSVSSVTLIHGMSRPLGARFHLAHGRSNAVLMPAVTAYSLAGARERYAQCSEALGLDGDDARDALHEARKVCEHWRRAMQDLTGMYWQQHSDARRWRGGVHEDDGDARE